MTTRPSRSASIPIPRTSSASPNIEAVISIPRIPSAQYPQRNSEHPSYGTRGSSSSATATSPFRPTARSMTLGPGAARRLPSTFAPRIVRVTPDQPRPAEACLPSSTSPARARRPSGMGGRATSAQRPTPTHFPPATPVSFPRPTYLDHSALRHLLQTDTSPPLPLSLKQDQPVHERHSTSAPSVLSDSDDDSNVTPPRELPPPPRSHDDILRLPTRWSEQCRHHLLSISPDGRDISYHGAFTPQSFLSAA